MPYCRWHSQQIVVDELDSPSAQQPGWAAAMRRAGGGAQGAEGPPGRRAGAVRRGQSAAERGPRQRGARVGHGGPGVPPRAGGAQGRRGAHQRRPPGRPRRGGARHRGPRPLAATRPLPRNDVRHRQAPPSASLCAPCSAERAFAGTAAGVPEFAPVREGPSCVSIRLSPEALLLAHYAVGERGERRPAPVSCSTGSRTCFKAASAVADGRAVWDAARTARCGCGGRGAGAACVSSPATPPWLRPLRACSWPPMSPTGEAPRRPVNTGRGCPPPARCCTERTC